MAQVASYYPKSRGLTARMDTFLVTRKIAWGVPQYEGFTFTDPFDQSPVIWYPVRVSEHEIRSNTKGESYKLKTDVPMDPLNAEGRADVNRYKLQQELAPMLVHAMDSAFSGFVIEGLVERGDKTIVALFDCWFVQEGCTGREERRARCLEQC